MTRIEEDHQPPEANSRMEIEETVERFYSTIASVNPDFIFFELVGNRLDFKAALRDIAFPDYSSSALEGAHEELKNTQHRLESIKPEDDLDRVLVDSLLLISNRIIVGDYHGSGAFANHQHPLLPITTLSSILNYFSYAEGHDVLDTDQSAALFAKLMTTWESFAQQCNQMVERGFDPQILTYAQGHIAEGVEALVKRLEDFSQKHEIPSVAPITTFLADYAETVSACESTDAALRGVYIEQELTAQGITRQDIEVSLERLQDRIKEKLRLSGSVKIILPADVFTLVRRFMKVRLGRTFTAGRLELATATEEPHLQAYGMFATPLGLEPRAVIGMDVPLYDIGLEPAVLHEVGEHLTYFNWVDTLLTSGQISPTLAGLLKYYPTPMNEALAVYLEGHAEEMAAEIGETASDVFRMQERWIRAEADRRLNLENQPLEEVIDFLKHQRLGYDLLNQAKVNVIVNNIVNKPLNYIIQYVIAPERLAAIVDEVAGSNYWARIAFIRQVLALGRPSFAHMKELAAREKERLSRFTAYDLAEIDKRYRITEDWDKEVVTLLGEVKDIIHAVNPVDALMLQTLNHEDLTLATVNGQRYWHGVHGNPEALETVRGRAEQLLIRAKTMRERLMKALKSDPSKLASLQAIEQTQLYLTLVLNFGVSDMVMGWRIAERDPMFMLYPSMAHLYVFWSRYSDEQRREILTQLPEHLVEMFARQGPVLPQQWKEFERRVGDFQKEVLGRAGNLGIRQSSVVFPQIIFEPKGLDFDEIQARVEEEAPRVLQIYDISPQAILQQAERVLDENTTDVVAAVVEPPVNYSIMPRYSDALACVLQQYSIDLPQPPIAIHETQETVHGSSWETDKVGYRIHGTRAGGQSFKNARESLIQHELDALGRKGLAKFFGDIVDVDAAGLVKRVVEDTAGMSADDFARFTDTARKSVSVGVEDIQRIDPSLIAAAAQEVGLNYEEAVAALKNLTPQELAEFTEKPSEDELMQLLARRQSLINGRVSIIVQLATSLARSQVQALADRPYDEQVRAYKQMRRRTLDNVHQDKKDGVNLFDNMGLILLAHESAHLVQAALKYLQKYNEVPFVVRVLMTPQSEGWLDCLAELMTERIINDRNLANQFSINPEHERVKMRAMRLMRAAQAYMDIKLNIERVTSEGVLMELMKKFDINFATAVATFLPMIRRARMNPMMLAAGYFYGYNKWSEVAELAEEREEDPIEALVRLRNYDPGFILRYHCQLLPA